MTRPAALERLAAHRADTRPRLVTGPRIETLRSLVVIAHDPKRLAANPAGRNAPDAGRAGRTVPPVAIVTGLGDRRKHGRQRGPESLLFNKCKSLEQKKSI